MIENIVSTFAKDCAKNYDKGVEFSVRFIWGPMSQVINVPRGIPEFQHLSNSRKREAFRTMLYGFLEKVDAVAADGEKYQLRIQYLPLQSKDYSVVQTYLERQAPVVENDSLCLTA